MTRVRTRLATKYPAHARYIATEYKPLSYFSGGWGAEVGESITPHKCEDETHAGPPYTSGGPLDITQDIYPTVPIQLKPAVWRTTANYSYWVGAQNLIPLRKFYGIADRYSGQLGLSEAELIGYGTEGWKRATYLRPNLDLNQTIGELRGLGQLFRNAQRSLRNLFEEVSRPGTVKTAPTIMKELSSGYLTWEFGISPIIQDLLSLKRAHIHTTKRIEHLRRMDGKVKHRTVELFKDTDFDQWSGTINVQPIQPTMPGQQIVDAGVNSPRTEEVTRTRRVWLEGRFGFHLPVKQGPYWYHREFIRQGLGIDLSTVGLLRTLYQLTPWSWLADWALSTGDVLANLVSIHNYGAFSKYAYVMSEDRCVYKTTYTIRPVQGANIPVPGVFISVRKQRLSASPFGFGLTMQQLSPWQISILAALGMSRYKP